MSTILDALKKSEQERKLNKLPTLTDIEAPQEQSRWPVVVAIVFAFIALLAALLAVYWWQAHSGSAPGSSSVKSSVVSDQPSKVVVIAEDGVVVNVVSYSDQPNQRFAMVNGKMVREGEFVEAGLVVEKINLDSVILNLRGKQITRKP